MKCIVIILLVLYYAPLSIAHEFQYIPTFNGHAIELNKNYAVQEFDTLSFSSISLYISDIVLFQDSLPVYKDSIRYHLLQAENPSSLAIKLPTTIPFTQISFTFGIDSIAQSHPDFTDALDPIHGMYWTWNSGYINGKIEGTSSLCSTSKHAFQFHIGGFRFPYATYRRITLPCHQSTAIAFDVASVIKKGIAAFNCTVMSPGEKAYTLSSLITPMFSIKR